MSPTGKDKGGLEAGLEAELDALYTAPLDQFVARRDALARGLKESGDADGSRRVKALRKPSVVAWAINRLHLEREGLADIATASEALRVALRQPRSAEERRAAIEQRRRALEGATSAAVELLEAAGSAVTPALVNRIERTLLAVATGGAGAAHPAPGRLDQELEPPGFEAIFEGPSPAAATPPSKPASKEAPAPPAAKTVAKPGAKAAARAAVEKAPAAKVSKPPATVKTPPPQRSNVRDFRHEAAVRKAQAELDGAEGELERATNVVEERRMRVSAAEKALVLARKEVDEARRELAAVRSRRDEARRELDRAKKERDS